MTTRWVTIAALLLLFGLGIGVRTARGQAELDIDIGGIEDVVSDENDELTRQMSDAEEGDHETFKVVTDDDTSKLAVGDIYKSSQTFFKIVAIKRQGADGGVFVVERFRGAMDPSMRWNRVSGEGTLTISARETMLDRFFKGGLVMYPISFLLLVMIIVTISGASYYRLSRHCPLPFQEACRDALEAGDIEKFEALSVSQPGLLAQVCRVMVANFRRLTVDEIKSRVEAAAVHEVGRMTFPLRVLNFVAVAAPLLGLLGTVIGMIVCFDSLAGEAATQSKAMQMAAGIKQALLTTAFGLVVALPSLLVFFIYNYKVNEIANLCAVAAEELIHEIAVYRRDAAGGVGGMNAGMGTATGAAAGVGAPGRASPVAT